MFPIRSMSMREKANNLMSPGSTQTEFSDDEKELSCHFQLVVQFFFALHRLLFSGKRLL